MWGSFELVTGQEFYLYDFSDDSSKRCMLEVNLEYPKEIYIFTMIYLFDDVSFRKESLLHDKKLQLYWKFRLQLKKFHRVLKIDQHYLNP